MSDRNRNHVFTWNNYTPEAVAWLRSGAIRGCKYIHFAHEMGGKEKTPHLQGYVQWDESTSLAQACKRLEPKGIKTKPKHTVWCAVANGSKLANQKYCFKKKDTDPSYIDSKGRKLFYIWDNVDGELSCKAERKKFTRSGGCDEWHHKFAAIEDHGDLLKFAKEYPEIAIKNCHGIKTLSDLVGKQLDADEAKSLYPKNLRLFIWQRSLVNMIDNNPPEGRKIIWFYDKLGKSGKTVLAVYLKIWYDACFLGNAGSAHMIHGYKNETIVCIDLCKSELQDEMINYKAIEALKNGAMFSSKYDSTSKVGKRPWVFVFANMRPDTSKMAQDRFTVINLRTKGTDFCKLEDDPDGKLKIFKENDHTEKFLNDPVFGKLLDNGKKNSTKKRISSDD